MAISAYLLISASFWYIGMIPDFATIRDKTISKIKRTVYGILSFGWTGSSREWMRYESTGFVLGGIAAVLVVSVHSIVSTDFASSVIPMAYNALPALFRGRAIFRICYGNDTDDPDPEAIQIPGIMSQIRTWMPLHDTGICFDHGNGLSDRNLCGVVFRNQYEAFLFKAG
jgi:hypothetical protein